MLTDEDKNWIDKLVCMKIELYKSEKRNEDYMKDCERRDSLVNWGLVVMGILVAGGTGLLIGVAL